MMMPSEANTKESGMCDLTGGVHLVLIANLETCRKARCYLQKPDFDPKNPYLGGQWVQPFERFKGNLHTVV